MSVNSSSDKHPGVVHEVELTDLAFDGKAVGKIDGKVIFLDRGLPGERVAVRIVKNRRKYIIGRVDKIIEASPERVEPPCAHFNICGGCTWQDLNYEKQLHYKEKQVKDCLEHIGHFRDIPLDKITAAPDIFHYRNKMEFSFNTTDGDSKFHLGLHERGHFDRIFDVDRCFLQDERANEILLWFRDFVARHDIPIYDVRQHFGYMRFLIIRRSFASGKFMLNIVTSEGELPHREALIEEARRRFDNVATIVHNVNTGQSNIAKGESEEILYGDGYITEEVLGLKFRLYANSFFQTNPRQAETLYRLALDLAELNGPERVMDLYCGTGTIGICASRRAAFVTGVELESSAIAAAEQNAALNGIDNIRFLSGSVQELMRDHPEAFADHRVAIVDPPRAGMHPKALKHLINFHPPRLIFISCNPATFARDARALVDAGYSLDKIIPVDMFPHTMHIELVARFNSP